MKKEEVIYFTLCSWSEFSRSCDNREDFDVIEKERNKIAERYSDLKKEYSYTDAYRIATIEWLMGNESDS